MLVYGARETRLTITLQSFVFHFRGYSSSAKTPLNGVLVLLSLYKKLDISAVFNISSRIDVENFTIASYLEHILKFCIHDEVDRSNYCSAKLIA